MTGRQCPICFGALEVRDVAPCYDCGGDPDELVQLAEGKHTYQRMRVLGDFEMILCDFCEVDFGSYDPTFFGLPRDARIGFETMQLMRDVDDVSVSKDQFCPECNKRLAFLRVVADCRERNQ